MVLPDVLRMRARSRRPAAVLARYSPGQRTGVIPSAPNLAAVSSTLAATAELFRRHGKRLHLRRVLWAAQAADFH